jgi:hypothetical protein
MTSKLVPKTLLLVVGFSVLALTAITSSAQWQWVEKDGRKTFSDRAPPAEIAEKNILQRPSVAAKAAAAPSSIAIGNGAALAPSESKASVPNLTGKDAELQARKKRLEDDEAQKKQADEEKLALGKADNCTRVKKAIATFESGLRLSSINAMGEREIMDDNTRAAESKRLQSIIDSDCK